MTTIKSDQSSHQYDTSEYVTLNDLPRRYTEKEIERIKAEAYQQGYDKANRQFQDSCDNPKKVKPIPYDPTEDLIFSITLED